MGACQAVHSDTLGNNRSSTARSMRDAQWHDVDRVNPATLAGPPGAIRSLADSLRSVHTITSRRRPRSDPQTSAGPVGCRWADPLGHLVRRRHLRACCPLYGWRFKKSRRRYPPKPHGHAFARPPGGFGTTHHVVTDGKGLLLALDVSLGQVHESTHFESVIRLAPIPQAGGRPRTRPAALAADNGHSYRRIREWLPRQKIKPVIPRKPNQSLDGLAKFDRAGNRMRSFVGNGICWLTGCRRIGPRFEMLAVNPVTMLTSALIDR